MAKIKEHYRMKKILIANRGEIAVRIIRACQEMGIKTVAIYSTADKNSMHVKLADETICIGGPSTTESYLNKANIISAALVCGADSIHPGFGFLSENADFVEMVEDNGFTFVGPSSEHIRIMGDKIEAKNTAIKLGLPCVPGSKGAVKSPEEAKKIAKQFGYPVLIKAASGGGGRGMKVAYSESDIEDAFNLATHEAKVSFGDSTVYMEKFLQNPKHIEVQILGDMHGNVVHLYERDCSVQRRNQKVIEEALSPALTTEQREYICELSAKAMKKMGYYSVGTIEYLFENGEFYFMEMNTRLQVEHPVTECITGVDLVYEMIRISQGKPLKITQKDIRVSGHAIECRINAEDPETFLPRPGKINIYHSPGGPGIRVDTAIYVGYIVPPYYDSMIAKLIVFGNNRQHCLMRLNCALNELIIEGVAVTNIALHKRLINEPKFIDGSYTIKWLEQELEKNTNNS